MKEKILRSRVCVFTEVERLPIANTYLKDFPA